MKHAKLREIAKLLSGFILADFCLWWWVASHTLTPITLLGVSVTSNMIAPGMLFDAALFIILIHYGWHIGKTPQLSSKTYFRTIGTILGAIALIHFIRIFSGSAFVILGWNAPIWISGIGIVVAAYLSYMSFRLAGKK